MRATKLAFEKQYRDESGVEFAVRLDEKVIKFESINEVSFPLEEVDWLISALVRIKRENSPEETP